MSEWMILTSENPKDVCDMVHREDVKRSERDPDAHRYLIGYNESGEVLLSFPDSRGRTVMSVGDHVTISPDGTPVLHYRRPARAVPR